MIYYFTGQPGAGKTTIGELLINYLVPRQFIHAPFIHIDGDDIREIFDNKDYSEMGRRKNIEKAQDIAQFLHEKGYNVVITLVSPYRGLRSDLKSKAPVTEIYVHTSEIRGKEKFHVKDYEPPIENFIDLDTTNLTVEESFHRLMERI